MLQQTNSCLHILLLPHLSLIKIRKANFGYYKNYVSEKIMIIGTLIFIQFNAYNSYFGCINVYEIIIIGNTKFVSIVTPNNQTG